MSRFATDSPRPIGDSCESVIISVSFFLAVSTTFAANFAKNSVLEKGFSTTKYTKMAERWGQNDQEKKYTLSVVFIRPGAPGLSAAKFLFFLTIFVADDTPL